MNNNKDQNKSAMAFTMTYIIINLIFLSILHWVFISFKSQIAETTYICLCVSLPVCIILSVCLFVSVCLPVSLTDCQSACVSLSDTDRQTDWQKHFACLFVCQSVCLPVCLCQFVCLFQYACLSVFVSLHIFVSPSII